MRVAALLIAAFAVMANCSSAIAALVAQFTFPPDALGVMLARAIQEYDLELRVHPWPCFEDNDGLYFSCRYRIGTAEVWAISSGRNKGIRHIMIYSVNPILWRQNIEDIGCLTLIAVSDGIGQREACETVARVVHKSWNTTIAHVTIGGIRVAASRASQPAVQIDPVGP